jgi:hypothetical protein
VQEQSDSDCASRSAFCGQFVTLVNEHPDVIRQWIKSNEAHFEQTKMRYCSEANRNEVHVEPPHSQRVTAWSRISASGITGPYFCEDETGSAVVVTSDRYAHSANELFPELRRRDIELATNTTEQQHVLPAVDGHLKNCLNMT